VHAPRLRGKCPFGIAGNCRLRYDRERTREPFLFNCDRLLHRRSCDVPRKAAAFRKERARARVTARFVNLKSSAAEFQARSPRLHLPSQSRVPEKSAVSGNAPRDKSQFWEFSGKSARCVALIERKSRASMPLSLAIPARSGWISRRTFLPILSGRSITYYYIAPASWHTRMRDVSRNGIQPRYPIAERCAFPQGRRGMITPFRK